MWVESHHQHDLIGPRCWNAVMMSSLAHVEEMRGGTLTGKCVTTCHAGVAYKLCSGLETSVEASLHHFTVGSCTCCDMVWRRLQWRVHYIISPTSFHAGVTYKLCYGLQTSVEVALHHLMLGSCTSCVMVWRLEWWVHHVISRWGSRTRCAMACPHSTCLTRVHSFGVPLCAGAPGCNCSLDSCVVMAVPSVTSSRPRRASTRGMLGFFPLPPVELHCPSSIRSRGSCTWSPCD
jgi:hypothetical protein